MVEQLLQESKQKRKRLEGTERDNEKGVSFFTADMFGLKVVANDLIGNRVGIIVDGGI